MHSWKKKLVVSQLALACTLAITSQANAANQRYLGYHGQHSRPIYFAMTLTMTPLPMLMTLTMMVM